MGAVYATVEDISAVGRTLTNQQEEAAEVLLEQTSAKLRLTAAKYGKNIDSMIADPVAGEDYALAVKAVVVQAVCRALDSVESNTVATQGSQTLGAYSVQQTYFNPGQSLYFLRNELKDLGLMQQRYGLLDMFGGGNSGEPSPGG